jgi:tetratricopeptide (TPR) repeat protein
VLRRLPKDPLAIAACLEAHLVASCVYEKQLPEKSRAELARAGQLAAALKAEATFGRAVRAYLLYLDHIDDLKGVEAEYLRNPTTKALTGRTYFFILYRHHKYDEALDLLKEIPRTGNEAMYYMRRGFTLANLKDNGPARALEQFEDAWKVRGDGRNRVVVFAPNILFLLGRRTEAVKHYQEMLDTTTGASFYHSAYEFWADRRSEGKLLEEAGHSRWMQCEAHYYIGIKMLAEGKRPEARDHFQKSVDTRVLWYLEYEWSRALLGQMQDPDWPPWIK